ncbi:MAG: hypothetical protein WCT49_03140 [Candidatus Paceibacterota bacterium]
MNFTKEENGEVYSSYKELTFWKQDDKDAWRRVDRFLSKHREIEENTEDGVHIEKTMKLYLCSPTSRRQIHPNEEPQTYEEV